MNNNIVIFKGYLAEMIRLQAEKKGMTPEAYVLSFFEKRCNAPRGGIQKGVVKNHRRKISSVEKTDFICK